MSQELRELADRRIDETLQNVTETILSGAPKEYAVYRDLTGYVRGLRAAQALMRGAHMEIMGLDEHGNPLKQPEK